MASSKRPPHRDDHDRDGQAPGNKSKRRLGQGDCLPTQLRTIRDIFKGEWMAEFWERWLRKIVQEELTTRLERHPCAEESLDQTGTSEGRRKTYRLCFKDLPRETFTNRKIVAKDRTCLQVALYQCDAGGLEESIVGEGPLSCIEIELCVLHGDLGSNGREVSSEEFGASIIPKSRRGDQLLIGDTVLKLTKGVGFVANLCVTDISKCARKGSFRLGAKVAKPTHDEANIIKEGISQPFRVKDIRGEVYQKHVIPSKDDKIWRLKGIAKGGKRDEQLRSLGIETIDDFLHRLQTNPQQLKQDFGRVAEKTWKDLIRQANNAYAIQDAGQPHLPTVTLDSENSTTTNACVLQGGGNSHIYPSTQQPYLPAGPPHWNQQLLMPVYGNVQPGPSLPQHDDLLTAHPGLFVPSTSPLHIGEAVPIGQPNWVGSQMFSFEDDNLLDNFVNSPAANEGFNSAVYISSKGAGLTVWSKIRNAFKVAFLSISLSKRKRKLVIPHDY